MKYNPDKHHRRSIRLQGYNYTTPGTYFITLCTHQRQCLFGAIVNGEMQLNTLGQMVNAYWQRLPFHFPHLTLDAFVVMPNHIHGILVLTNPGTDAALNRRGAALDDGLTDLIENVDSNATPNPDDMTDPNAMPDGDSSEPGVAYPTGSKLRAGNGGQTQKIFAECRAPTGTIGGGVSGGDRFEF